MLRYKKTTSFILFIAVLHFFLPYLMAFGLADCFEKQKMTCCEGQAATAVSMGCCENMDHEMSDPIQNEVVVLKYTNTEIFFSLFELDFLPNQIDHSRTIHSVEIDYLNTPIFNNKLYLPLSVYLI